MELRFMILQIKLLKDSLQKNNDSEDLIKLYNLIDELYCYMATIPIPFPSVEKLSNSVDLSNSVEKDKMEWTYTYNKDKKVGFKKMNDGEQFIKTRQKIGEKDICPLCKTPFTFNNTTAILLVISNQVGVPNRFCHSECIADKSLEWVFKIINDDYEIAKKYIKWLEESGWNYGWNEK